MKRIIIVHRWSGSSQADWYPWIKTELEKLNYEVLVPDMPNTDSPTMDTWINKLKEVVGTPDKNTYFIGHSIGCKTILRYLEEINMQVGGALFVAGWFNLKNLEDNESKEIAKPWIETPINKEKISEILPTSVLLISKDDPYGAFEENISEFGKFVTHSCVFDHAGHFTETKEPAILSQIQSLLGAN